MTDLYDPSSSTRMRSNNLLLRMLKAELDKDISTPTDSLPESRVILISGDRGSGKTTLLQSACLTTAQSETVAVLRVIEPELFTIGDSIVGLAILRVARYLETENNHLLDSRVSLPGHLGGPQTVRQTLDRLLRISHLLRLDNQIASTTLDQQLSDLSKAAHNGETFAELWQEVMLHLSRPSGHPDVPRSLQRILVPIDDPDLRPELLPQLLSQIRLLSRTPMIAVCVCLNLHQARDTLASHHQKLVGGTEDQARHAADSELLKTFPSYLRVELRSLGIDERLHFQPPQGDTSVVQLMSAFTMKTSVGDRSLSSIVNVTEHLPLKTSPASDNPQLDTFTFWACLPALPRELVNLHRSLSNLSHAMSDSPARSRAAIEILLDACVNGNREASVFPADERSRITFGTARGKTGQPTIYIDTTDIDVLTRNSDTYSDVPIGTVGHVDIGSVTEVRGRVIDQTRRTEFKGPFLNRGSVQTLLLAREFSQFAHLFDDELSGGEPIYGGKANALVNLTISSDEGDRYFHIPPRWRSYGDTYTFLTSWMQNRRNLERLQEDSSSSVMPHIGDVLLLILLRSTINTQALRTSFVIAPADLAQYCFGSTDALMTEIDSALQAIYGYILAHKDARVTSREGALLQWIDQFVPQALHPSLVSAEAGGLVMDVRRKAKMASALGESERTLIALLRRRIKSNYGQDWIDGLLRFAETLPSFDDLPGLQHLHYRAQQQKRSARLSDRSELVTAESELIVDLVPQVFNATKDADIARRVLDDMLSDAKREAEVHE